MVDVSLIEVDLLDAALTATYCGSIGARLKKINRHNGFVVDRCVANFLSGTAPVATHVQYKLLGGLAKIAAHRAPLTLI